MTFNHPYWLFLLELVPLLLLFYLRNYKKRQAAIEFSSLLSFTPSRQTVKKYLIHLPFLLRLTAVSLVVTALAEPRTLVGTLAEPSKGSVIFLIDLSGNMRSRDFTPSRLSAASSALARLTEQSNALQGIVVMDTSGRVAVPLTTDKGAIQNAFFTLAVTSTVQNASFEKALPVCATLLELAPEPRFICCISGGQGNDGRDLSSLTSVICKKKISLVALTVAGEGTISGKVFGNTLDDGLEQLCRACNGWYTRTTTSSELDQALYGFIRNLSKPKTYLAQKDRSFLLAVLAAFTLIIDFLISNTIFKTLP